MLFVCLPITNASDGLCREQPCLDCCQSTEVIVCCRMLRVRAARPRQRMMLLIMTPQPLRHLDLMLARLMPAALFLALRPSGEARLPTMDAGPGDQRRRGQGARRRRASSRNRAASSWQRGGGN